MDPLSRLIGIAYLVQTILLGMQALVIALLLASGMANLVFANSASKCLRRAQLLRHLTRQGARGFGIGQLCLGGMLLLPVLIGAPFWLTLLALAGVMALFLVYKGHVGTQQAPPGPPVTGVLLVFPALLLCVTLYERADMLEASRRIFGGALAQRVEALRWQAEHDLASPSIGDMAVDFELSDPSGTRSVRLFDQIGEKPVALIFGSHT
jgi:hypothetical protein